jgi:hypothetical protein
VVAVTGGLFSATVLKLIAIPVVYEILDDARTWVRQRLARASVASSGIVRPADGIVAGDRP